MKVEHVKAHRSKNEVQQMSLFERFVIEGSERADELAKEGAMMDGGVVAQVRASTVQQEREEGFRIFAVRSQFSLSVGGLERV